MLSDHSTPRTSSSKKSLTVFFVLISITALYVAWVMLSRYQEDRAYNQRLINEAAQKQRQRDQAAIEQLGGSELGIQMLYATPQIRRGETAQLCYGVANAKTISFNPPIADAWLSHSHCVDVKPNKTTTYTLTATAADGKSVSQQVTISVR